MQTWNLGVHKITRQYLEAAVKLIVCGNTYVLTRMGVGVFVTVRFALKFG